MKYRLKVLLLSSLFINLAVGLFGPLYAIFVEEIGGDLLTAGSAYAIYAIASGVLIFFIGKWEDHVKHQEKLLIVSRFFDIIGIGGYLFVHSPIHLFIVQAILGISTAIGSPAYGSLYSKNLTKGKFASQWGTWESLVNITIGISAIIGGYLAKSYGFTTLFSVMLVISVISFIITLFLFKELKKILK